MKRISAFANDASSPRGRNEKVSYAVMRSHPVVEQLRRSVARTLQRAPYHGALKLDYAFISAFTGLDFPKFRRQKESTNYL